MYLRLCPVITDCVRDGCEVGTQLVYLVDDEAGLRVGNLHRAVGLMYLAHRLGSEPVLPSHPYRPGLGVRLRDEEPTPLCGRGIHGHSRGPDTPGEQPCVEVLRRVGLARTRRTP